MPITFLVDSALESTGATITVANATTSGPATRLYDRDRGLLFAAASSGAVNVDVDAGAGKTYAANGLGIVGHNLQTSAVILYRSSDAALFTEITRFDPRGMDPFLSTFNATSTDIRVWRVQCPASSVKVTMAELLVGSINVVSENPDLGKVGEDVVGNVQIDESPAGNVWSLRRGNPRTKLRWAWGAMSETGSWVPLTCAFEKSKQSVYPFVVNDPAAILRWMRFVNPQLESERVTTGLRSTKVELLEAL